MAQEKLTKNKMTQCYYYFITFTDIFGETKAMNEIYIIDFLNGVRLRKERTGPGLEIGYKLLAHVFLMSHISSKLTYSRSSSVLVPVGKTLSYK